MRSLLLLVLVTMLAAAVLGSTAAGAQETTEPAGPTTTTAPGATTTTAPGATTTTAPIEDQTGVRGQLLSDDAPIAGVTISVATASGEVIGEVVSGEDGAWFLPVPEPGEYVVTLDAETLPDDVELRAPDRNPLTLPVQGGRTRVALFGLQPVGAPADADGGQAQAPSASRDDGPPLSRRLAAQTVDGIVFGLILAVAAIGLSLIFGTTKLVNFAHGEMVTLGAIVAWFLSSSSVRLPVVVAGLIAVVIGGLAGLTTEVGLWRPLRRRRTGQFQLLVISIGLSIVLRQALRIWFGASDKRFRQYSVQRTSWELGPFRVTPLEVALVLICVVVLVGVALMLQRTRIGKALRAVSDNPDLASSSGIDVRRVIVFVWVLGGALAAGGGVLQGVATRVDYLMGFNLLLLMFAGVILGGLGTAYGAMVGGLVVGLATEISTLWVSTELKTVAALLVLVLVLLIRPQGILGQRERVG